MQPDILIWVWVEGTNYAQIHGSGRPVLTMRFRYVSEGPPRFSGEREQETDAPLPVANLEAVIRALRGLTYREKHHVLVHSDCAYAIGVITGKMRAKVNLDLVREAQGLAAECASFDMVYARRDQLRG